MKRFVQFLGAATLLLSFTQCSEDATTDSAPSVQGSVKLTASINETRTELSGNDVLWKSNDRLGLFCGTKFVNAPFTTTAGGTTSADFTGDPTDPSGSEAEVFYAYYPYSAHAVLEGSVVSGLSIPAVQTFATKSFATELCPMATSGADYSRLAFRTIGTVLKFQVTGQKNVTKIELTGNNGEALAGDYTIDFVGETPEMKFSGTETTLTLTCPEPVALNDASATEFYFVLPAGVEFTKGITVKVYTDDNAEPMVKEYASPLTTRPNKLVTVKAFTYSVPVTSIEEANEALSKGTSGVTITSTTDLTVPSTLEIPNAFGHGTSASVEIEQPVSTDLTISEKTTSDKELPETLSVEMETTASLIVDTPNLTVSLEGSYTTVEATTAENTLIVAKNTVIETLTVKKGNVKIYGTVGEIVNEGTGKIIRCIDAQDEVERTLADTRCDHILIEKPAGTLDFGGGTTTKQVCVEASVTIANLIVSPEKEHPVMVSGDNVKLTLDGVKLVCNAAKTYAVNCLDGANPDVTLSNSEIIALGTDCRAVSVVNTRATSDTSYITFDNTQARTSQTAIGNREYTADEIKYFTSRVADGNYYPRGISVGSTGGKVNIALRNNSCIEGFFYGINIAGITEPVDVAIDDSRLDGRAALNVHGQKCIFRVNRSTLVGRNYFGGPTEDFATVVLDRAVATSHSNTVTVTDSEIYSYNKPQTATNHQYSIDIRSLHNTVELKGSTRLIEVGSTEYPSRLNFMVCYDNSTDNVVNVDPGVTVSGKEGAKVLPATVWDGSSVYAPAADADGDYPIYEAAELKWIADQINSGNYLYLEAKGRYAQVYLMNDIDLNNKPWTPMGCQNHSYTLSGVDKCAFYGEFHGTGHTVSNLNVDIVADAKGFIGKTLGKEASIRELTLKNVAIPLNDDAEIQGKWVGALVGCMGGDTNVSDCHVENVTIHAPGMYRIGGLVGVWTNTSRQNATATVENCSVKDATLTAGYAIGGFMGTIQPQKPAAGYNTIRNCSVENISITHKDQYCWGDDPNYAAYYPETGHYCYSSAPFAGDVNNVNLEKCTVGGSCTIADADGHNTYMSATWTKLPYMGEVGGNACIDGVKVSADPTPAEGYFTK